MSDAAGKLAELQKLYPQAAQYSEGGKAVALIPGAKFEAGGKPQQMALLLVPFSHSGYVTRLFFERKLEGAGESQNWMEHTLLSRKWWAPSWKNVAPSLAWSDMVCAHLRAVA